MIFNKTICLSIVLILLSQASLHGMENLRGIVTYNPADSDALGIGINTPIHSLHMPKRTLNKEKKTELANKKLENKATMLNNTTAIAAAVVSAPIIFYAAGETLPIISSGIGAIAQTGYDVYDFLKESLPNWN